ncbi:dienelactone hydrolase family protein [Legionella sp. W05-934-2]|jgi:predicted alpha/beta-hydrolase family hydrolase|uniref:dienelactone hydrolase family protein n=1 Tax=Legionella sp. W05-934-2 TaxID=1198649 RepID=UPI003461B244
MNISIPIDSIHLNGILTIPEKAKSIVIFAHGSGSSRLSPRNNQVAQYLNQVKIATLLFDLLTEQEESIDIYTREYRFDIPLLADRLVKVTQWFLKQSDYKKLCIGYWGSSTGAAAALIAAAVLKQKIKAIVSRGGRPDLAGEYLSEVISPTLLIVGSLDSQVIELNKQAIKKMIGHSELKLVSGATHLFEEPGTFNIMIGLAKDFFIKHLNDQHMRE